MEFKKAQRKQVKIKVALSGVSGSGKTYSALLLAKGLAHGGKIAVLDTENDSASLYADIQGLPEFDHLTIHAPFHTQKYIQAIELAVSRGYSVLIIDSISHQWSGEGGIMDRMDKDRIANPRLNSYTNWSKYTPEHEKFKSAITQSHIHIVATMRSKQEYSMDKDDKGKAVISKMGMAPIQRDQFEYEFTTVFDIAQNHYCSVSKDRTNLFDNQQFVITEKTGDAIYLWLQSGNIPAEPPVQPEPKPVSPVKPVAIPKPVQPNPVAQKSPEPQSVEPKFNNFSLLQDVRQKSGWTMDQFREYAKKKYNASSSAKLSPEQIQEFIETMKSGTAELAHARMGIVDAKPQFDANFDQQTLK